MGLSGNTRIQIFPPRLMWRVMARRAASIFRAVKRTRSVALRPNSPKLALLPRFARPRVRPFIFLQNFVRIGCSIAIEPYSNILSWILSDRLLDRPELHL